MWKNKPVLFFFYFRLKKNKSETWAQTSVMACQFHNQRGGNLRLDGTPQSGPGCDFIKWSEDNFFRVCGVSKLVFFQSENSKQGLYCMNTDHLYVCSFLGLGSAILKYKGPGSSYEKKPLTILMIFIFAIMCPCCNLTPQYKDCGLSCQIHNLVHYSTMLMKYIRSTKKREKP